MTNCSIPRTVGVAHSRACPAPTVRRELRCRERAGLGPTRRHRIAPSYFTPLPLPGQRVLSSRKTLHATHLHGTHSEWVGFPAGKVGDNQGLEVLQLVQRASIRDAPAASGLPPGCRIALVTQLAAGSGLRASIRCVGRRRERHARRAARANPGVLGLVLAVVGTAPPRGSRPPHPRRRGQLRCSRLRCSQLRCSQLRCSQLRCSRQRRGRLAGCIGCV